MTITYSDMYSKLFSSVVFEGKMHDVPVFCPDRLKLFNFSFNLNDDYCFFVLDNYGDEIIPSSFYKRILGTELFHGNLVIEKKTGKIYLGTFHEDDDKDIIQFIISDLPTELFVPKEYRNRISELVRKKRPYHFDCDKDVLWRFLDQEASFVDLRENVFVKLNFDNEYITCEKE